MNNLHGCEIESNLPILDLLPSRLQSVYLDQLLLNGTINEVHNTYKIKWFKRKKVKTEHVGIWGWNSWCGIHMLPILTNSQFREILQKTISIGFTKIEPSTGLLPHAVLHTNGDFANHVEYKCYGGKGGESYNLDNILCWAKMALEFFLFTNDSSWILEKLPSITTTIDYILSHFRERFNPLLVYAGIEGDWTECTDWELDNSNVNSNLIRTLDLLNISYERLMAQNIEGEFVSTKDKYQAIREQIYEAFNSPVEKGGFWNENLGYYIHGNNGDGSEIQGDQYFESTVNYFALLWDLVPSAKKKKLWNTITQFSSKLEFPYPVLTNYLPRTKARRTNYRNTVTNGDVWVVLGSHAAAARLQAGFTEIGSRMYQTILDYDKSHGVLHNSIYKNGVNDSWDPEIGNYGALYAAFVYGVLGVKHLVDGVEFNLQPLQNMRFLNCKIYLFGQEFQLDLRFAETNISGSLQDKKGNSTKIDSRKFVIPLPQ